MRGAVAFLMIALSFACTAWNAQPVDAVQERTPVEVMVEEAGFFGAFLLERAGTVELRQVFPSPASPSLTIDTRFYIASISKQFCTVIVLQLWQDGLIEFNAPVSRYLSDFEASYADMVTVEDLLTHRAGLPEFYTGEGIDTMALLNQAMTLDEVTAQISGHPTERGIAAAYADTHFILLAAIIEQVTDSSYHAVVRKRIIEPLNLVDTGFYSGQDDDTAPLFMTAEADAVKAAPVNRRIAYGAGDMYSTVDDLQVFADAMYRGDLLSKQARDLMLQQHTTMGSPYGYGVWIEFPSRPPSSSTIFHHGGGPSLGVNTILAWHPAYDNLKMNYYF